MSGLTGLRHNWPWMLGLGIVSIVWGILAILYSMLFTLVSVLALACILIVGGAIEGVSAIQHHDHRHFLLYVLEAIVAIVAGALLLRSPAVGALIITLLLASYFVVIGIFRIVASLTLQWPGWGWTLGAGAISLAIGIVVWGGWPLSAFWVLGVFVGINLILGGWARVMLALALHSGSISESVLPRWMSSNS